MVDAWNQGVLIFFAAGNNAIEVSQDLYPYPMAISSPHITVGSLSENWDKAPHSNFGPLVDIYAPGQNITVLNRRSGVRAVDGTSFASPLVAGMALTLLAKMDPLPKAEDTARILATQILDLATEHKVGAIPGAGPAEYQRVAFNGGLDPR
ncbi:Peptidase S8/S53, subtilisin/kexin/sedolisin, partial [Metarhizium brunneum ARSEF 3297]